MRIGLLVTVVCVRATFTACRVSSGIIIQNGISNHLKIEIGTRVNDKSIVEEFKQKRNELRKNASYGNTTDVKLNKTIPLLLTIILLGG